MKYLAIIAITLIGFSITGCSTSTEPFASTDIGAESIISNDFLQDTSTCVMPPIRLQDTLQLSQDQINALQAAEDSLRQIEKDAITAAKGDRTGIRAAMDAFRQSMKSAIESILTPEQLALLQSLKPKFGPRDAEGCRGGHHGEPQDSSAKAARLAHLATRDSALLLRLTTELALTENQIAQIQTLQAQIRTEQPADPRNAFYTGLQSILTADQLTKLDALIAAFPPRDDEGHGGNHHRGHGRR